MAFEILTPGIFEKSLIKDAERLVRKDKQSVQRRIFCFKGDREALVKSELLQIEAQTGEMYSTVKHFGVMEKSSSFGQVVNYRHCCERNARPTGRFAQIKEETKDVGNLSRLTRANSCNAYVAHQFVCKNDVQLCIQRIYAEHTGHDPHNPTELCRARLSPELIELIHHWYGLGYKPKQVHERCEAWARSQGHLNPKNRRYYPSKIDVRALGKQYRKKQMQEQVRQAGGIEKFCDTIYKEHIVYFQDCDESYSLPMLLVIQSKWQFDQFKKLGNGVCFLNATYNGSTAHGYSLYTLLVRNDRNRPVPVAFAFLSDESEDLIFEFLSKLRVAGTDKGYCWRPRAVMVDTDWKEIHALRRLFADEVPILLCWFRMLQVVLRWTVKDDSGLKFDKAGRQNLIKGLHMLKQCTTEEEFEVLWHDVIPRLPKKVVVYLTDTWKPIAPMWANFGRLLFRKFAEANLGIEQLFCTVKWQFFKQYINKPIEDLLQILMVDILSRSTNVSLLVEPGRLSKSDLARQNEEMEKAKGMLARGDASRIVWHSENNSQTVPSETLAGISYVANVSEMWCSCPHNQHGVKCKHLCLVELCCLTQGTDVDNIRETIASRIFVSGDYQLLENIFTLVNSATGFVNCVDLTLDKCICPAASFAVECVCRKVVRLYKDMEQSGGFLGANYPIAVYEEEVVDASNVVMDESGAGNGLEVERAVPWTGGSTDEITKAEQHAAEDDLLSTVEMPQFSGDVGGVDDDGGSDEESAPLSVDEAKSTCENILEKIGSGWKPDEKVLKYLRKLGQACSTTVPSPGDSKSRVVKVKRHVASAVATRSSKR